MKISMWMLADWLAKFDPEVKITEGARHIQAARIVSDETKISKSILYLSEATEGQVILANGRDIISVKSDDIFQIFNEVLDMMEYYNEWEASLNEELEKNGSLDHLLECGYRAFPFYIMVADAAFLMKAHFGLDDEFQNENNFLSVQQDSLLPLESLVGINRQHNIRMEGIGAYHIQVPNSQSAVTAACNLFLRHEHIGWLVALKNDALFTHGELHVMEELASFVERYQELHLQEEDELGKSAVFLDLIQGNQVKADVVDKRLRAFGWYEDDRKQVYVLFNEEENADDRLIMDIQLKRLGDSIFKFVYQKAVVLIVNYALTDVKSFESGLKAYLKGKQIVVGRSGTFENIFQLKTYYEGARIAAQFSEKKGIVVNFRDTVLPYSFAVLRDYAFTDIAHPALEQLRDYDRRHDGEMYETLFVFLEQERNFTLTAKIMNIHRSTLIYRLDRIRELTGLDLEDADTRFYLLLSFKMKKANESSQSQVTVL